MRWFEENDIRILSWPPRCPDVLKSRKIEDKKVLNKLKKIIFIKIKIDSFTFTSIDVKSFTNKATLQK